MKIYSKDNGYPAPLPFRIVLPNGLTRTDPSTFTAEEIADAGYVEVPNAPELQANQILSWSAETGNWVVEDKTPEQIQYEFDSQMNEVRALRDKLLANSDWVITKAVEQNTMDSLGEWKDYRQALRDLPQNTVDPYNPVWPTPPS